MIEEFGSHSRVDLRCCWCWCHTHWPQPLSPPLDVSCCCCCCLTVCLASSFTMAHSGVRKTCQWVTEWTSEWVNVWVSWANMLRRQQQQLRRRKIIFHWKEKVSEWVREWKIKSKKLDAKARPDRQTEKIEVVSVRLLFRSFYSPFPFPFLLFFLLAYSNSEHLALKKSVQRYSAQ